MKASIIIPNLNGEGWLEDSIRSCINQNFNGEYEIIVIDNGSKDRSVEIIKECAKDNRPPHLYSHRTHNWMGETDNYSRIHAVKSCK